MKDLKELEKYQLKITNPNKLLWRQPDITKLDYIKILVSLSHHILPHTKNRLLTVIRYPHGYEGESFFQKNAPDYTPEWVDVMNYHDKRYILLNNLQTLIWLGNQAAIELHLSFNDIKEMNRPLHLVFDLDPSKGQNFDDVIEVALLVKEVLDGLKIRSYVKTSGATGLQIYIPIHSRYTYEEARKINGFFAKYMVEKYSRIVTIERSVDKRQGKLYFDYLQMWKGKTIIAPYSPRATKKATLSMPLSWHEVEKGVKPEDFHLLNCIQRLKNQGDIFEPLLDEENYQNLDVILNFIQK